MKHCPHRTQELERIDLLLPLVISLLYSSLLKYCLQIILPYIFWEFVRNTVMTDWFGEKKKKKNLPWQVFTQV